MRVSTSQAGWLHPEPLEPTAAAMTAAWATMHARMRSAHARMPLKLQLPLCAHGIAVDLVANAPRKAVC